MAHTIRMTTVQLPAELAGSSPKAKKKKNLTLIESQLKRAGEASSDLVLFAEYANLWHRGTSNVKKNYQPDTIDAPVVQLVRSYAERYRMNIVFPMLASIDGITGSTCLLIDRNGEPTGSYRKCHPTIAEQKFGITAGADISVYTLDCARVGIMTCMDIEYPETAQTLMVKGAELLLFPHVQAGWGEIDWEIRMRARAIDTGLVLVSACYGYGEGEWKPGKMIGRSGVIGRDGTIISDLGRGIGASTVDVDLDAKRVTHFFFEKQFERTLAVLASRRPELYRALVSTHERDDALKKLQKQSRRAKKG
ncbi:MAG TPA: carbon-nitrogen hydrolase family protein [Bacteroidota bacterium]|nr:carbon-nitrogen hydrolase family protein [Bacteroidota bacterium]